MNTPHDVAGPRERAEALIDPHRDPIHEALGPHRYQESEFAEGAGRCDKCGGGEFAKIHLPVVEPAVLVVAELKNILDGLEMIATQSCRFAAAHERVAQACERIAEEIEYKRRCGAFWRLYEWLRGFFYRYSYDHVSGPPAPTPVTIPPGAPTNIGIVGWRA